MKFLIGSLALVLASLLVEFAWASDAAKPASKPAAPAASQQSAHSFEDLLVQGKYHFSDEAVTTVEEDKVLDSLLGVRSDFKDRIEQSSLRN